MVAVVIITLFFTGCEYDYLPYALFGGKGEVLDAGLAGLGTVDVYIEAVDSDEYSIEGASVYVDDVSVGTTDWGGDVYLYGLNTGPHKIIIKHPDYATYGPEIFVAKLESYQYLTFTLTTLNKDMYEDNNTMYTAYTPYFTSYYDYVYTCWGYECTIVDETIHDFSEYDWFQFDIGYGSSGGYIRVELSNIPYGCNYDIELYKDYGYLKGSFQSGTTSELIEHYPTGTGDGNYKVRIYSADTNSNPDSYYTLYIKYVFK